VVRFLAGTRAANIFQHVQICSGAHPVSDSRGIGGFFAEDIAFGVLKVKGRFIGPFFGTAAL
jgi:hypothetical protein